MRGTNGINLKANPAMPDMPAVFRLFPAATAARLVLLSSLRKTPDRNSGAKTFTELNSFMNKFGRNIIVLICAALLAGCAGISAVRKDAKEVRTYHAVKIITGGPNQCGSGVDAAGGGLLENLFNLQLGNAGLEYKAVYNSGKTNVYPKAEMTQPGHH